MSGWVCADQCMPELPASPLDPVMKSAFPEVREFLMEHMNKQTEGGCGGDGGMDSRQGTPILTTFLILRMLAFRDMVTYHKVG